MLSVVVSALAFSAPAPVMSRAAVRGVHAASPTMLLGLARKTKQVVSGKVVPTKGMAEATAKFADAAAAFATAAKSLNAASNALPFATPTKDPESPITLDEVTALQAGWASAIKTISATYKSGGDYVGTAGSAAGELYGYSHSQVLFKPTKAAEFPFRPTGAEAMSYFVGCDAVQDGYKEDGGFAINGGKGWKDVVFTNHQVDCHGEVAIAMGSYVFTCATTNDETKVEYTFGYKRNDDGNVRICLHHSSVPYSA